MNTNPETAFKQSGPVVDTNRRRFTTPLRKAFKRLRVTRKPLAPSVAKLVNADPLADCSNNPRPGSENVVERGKELNPPSAPRLSRWASPMVPPSPISPLPTTVSRSSNILTIRSEVLGTAGSCCSVRRFDDAASSSSSPIAPMPRGDLFQLGLTPVQSVRSIQSTNSHTAAEGPLFAPALPATQRVSTLNVARQTAGVDIINIVDMDVDTDAGDPEQTTPTPPSRTTSIQWLPPLSVEGRAARNSSTTAVFEGRGLVAERRRTSFMSKLVGSAWGLAGIGFTSMHGPRRAQSAALAPAPQSPLGGPALSSLPSIPLGKGSIEQAVFGPNVTMSRLSMASNGSRHYLLVNGLPPANSTMRMTGSKSSRAMDHLDEEVDGCESHVDVQAKIEERPKKKRRGTVNGHFVRSPAPSPAPARVTRAMAARQVDEESTTPTRVTRSTSMRLAELANTPTRKSYDGVARRSKSLKRL